MKDLFEILQLERVASEPLQLRRTSGHHKSAYRTNSHEEESLRGLALRQVLGGDDFLSDKDSSWFDLDHAFAASAEKAQFQGDMEGLDEETSSFETHQEDDLEIQELEF